MGTSGRSLDPGILLVIALMCLVGGCVSQPTPTGDEILKAYYGPQPQDVESTVKSYFQDTLLDPSSAQYRLTEPQKVWWNPEKNPYSEGTVEFGWIFVALVNAKNRFGAYVGWKEYEFVYRDEVLRLMIDDKERGKERLSQARARIHRIRMN